MLNGLSYLNILDRSISIKRGILVGFIITIIPLLKENFVDPDKMPHFAASEMGLHCLPMSFLWDTRHKWVKLQ